LGHGGNHVPNGLASESSDDPSGLGDGASSGGGGLDTGGASYAALCNKAFDLDCFEIEEATLEECIDSLVEAVSEVEHADAWLACLGAAATCDDMKECTEGVEDDYDYDEPEDPYEEPEDPYEEPVDPIEEPDFDCQQYCEDLFGESDLPPGYIDDCVIACREGGDM